MKKLLQLIIVGLLLMGRTNANIIDVPTDRTTIQSGIEAANDGDTVLVQPGTYIENINFLGKNIVVGSLFLITDDTLYISQTVIEGDSSASVVSFESGENPSAFLCGFKIINGTGTFRLYSVKPFPYGGGIFCENSNPVLSNLILMNNVSGGGGGIFFKNSNSICNNITIFNNNAYSPFDDSPNVGGGILLWDSNPRFFDLKIYDNICELAGGGVYCLNSKPMIKNTLIVNNYSHWWGGGIFCEINSDPKLINVTVAGNSAGKYGGGIFCWDNSNPTLVNSIFWNNYPQEIYFWQDFNPNSISISYSDIQGSLANIETNDNGIINWLEGNIDNYPFFIDTANVDFLLQKKSPCIDVGTAFFILEEDTLINLNPSEYIGSKPDMGAFEYGAITGVDNLPFIPNGFNLSQNYPNPFNPTTKFSYSIPYSNFVTLKIYDIQGREIQILVNEYQRANTYHITFDASNFSSGIYFYKLQVGNIYTKTEKMILVR